MSAGYDDDRYEGDDRRRDEGPDEPRRGRADIALQKVALPGMLMMLNGVLGLVVTVFLFVITVAAPDVMVDWLKQMVAAQPAGPEKQQNEQKVQDLEDQLKQDRVANAVTTGLELAVFGVLNLVAIFGGMKMRSGSFGWGLAASIITMIPCTTGCCCTGPLIGLWGLIVLMNEDVKAGFAAAARARARAHDGY